MNYEKLYNNLVQTRRDRLLKEGEYYEKHHILPKCLNGTNDNTNLVILTAREHYIAHWLLAKIYPTIWKLYFAFYQMSKMNKINGRVISGRQFDRSRKYLSDGMKLKHKDPSYVSPGKCEKSRRKASERMNSDRNPMKGRPERNPTARPHKVVFMDGTEKLYQYGRLGYEELGVPRSTWILATRTGTGIPKYNIKGIQKL